MEMPAVVVNWNGGAMLRDALASLFAPRIAQANGGDWHLVLGLSLIPIALTWLTIALFAKDSPGRPAPKGIREYFGVLKDADAMWFCLFYSITFGGFVGLATYLPIFFVDQYHIKIIQAGNLTALCVLAGSFVRPVGGYLADRFGGVKMLTILFGLIGMLALGVATLPPLFAVTALLFVLMTTFGLGNGAVFQLVPQRFPSQIGVMTGIVGAAGGIGGFLLPTLLGLLKQNMGSYGAGFASFGLMAICGIGLIMALSTVWQRAGWLAEGGKAIAQES